MQWHCSGRGFKCSGSEVAGALNAVAVQWQCSGRGFKCSGSAVAGASKAVAVASKAVAGASKAVAMQGMQCPGWFAMSFKPINNSLCSG